KNSGDAAEDALMERAPGHFEFGAFACFEAGGAGGRFGGLSQDIECVADVVQRHFRFTATSKTNSSATAGGAKAPPLQKQPHGSEKTRHYRPGSSAAPTQRARNRPKDTLAPHDG